MRGALALMFSVFLIASPGVSIFLAIVIFGCYAVADGISLIAISDLDGDYWWPVLFNGISSLIVGAAILLGSRVEHFQLLLVIGVWAGVRGVLEILAATRLNKAVACEWLMVLAGLLSLGFATIMLTSRLELSDRPFATTLFGTIWTALYTFSLGVVLLVLAFYLRSVRAVVGPAHSA